MGNVGKMRKDVVCGRNRSGPLFWMDILNLIFDFQHTGYSLAFGHLVFQTFVGKFYMYFLHKGLSCFESDFKNDCFFLRFFLFFRKFWKEFTKMRTF